MKKALLLITVAILLSFGLQAQEWNFGNDSTNFPDYAGVPAGTTVTINGLAITAGLTPTNMGLVEVSMKTFGTTTYHRRFKFNGAGYSGAVVGDLVPTVMMPIQRYVSFPVDGNSTILVHGITGNSGETRKLFVTDGKSFIGRMEMPAGSVITEATLTYRGPAATLYMFCNASINLYYMKVTPATIVEPSALFAGEDFESIKMNVFAEGTTGKVGVVPNPDPTGINTSVNVGMMVRAQDGAIYQGWSHDFLPTIDVTTNKYLHIKLWKTRISPIVVKWEKQGNPDAGDSGDTHPMAEQTQTGQWEEFVFDFTAYAGTVLNRLTLIPDFPATVVGLTEDINIYFDDIYLNNDPVVGSAPVIVLEDYEPIPLNIMEMGTNGKFTLVENPDKSGINTSSYVEKFVRPFDGQPWSGFWSALPAPIDATTNKYVHVKVWKPRISPIRFKLENNSDGTTLETVSKNPQTQIGKWEDIVFDFTTRTGLFPVIAFMPDFEDPLTLTEDIELYFDDIFINNDSTKRVSLTLNVDMHGAGLGATDTVYVAGTFPSWVAPGGDPALMLTDADGDSIYSITMVVPAGDKEFKFFINAGWSGGEWNAGANRKLTLESDTTANYVWGMYGMVNNRINPLAGKIQMYPNPVRDQLNINSTVDVRRVIITSTLGKVVGNFNYSSNRAINTATLSKGMYFITFIGKDGNKVTQKLIKN